MSPLEGKSILMIVENLPVPFDRRVWQEALALKNAGAYVRIICPKMKGFNASYEELEGIQIYRHPLPIEASGAIGYLLEYFIALFWEFLLSVKLFIKKRFHVIHGCNPPDLIFLVALPFKLFGVKYVFDHHDINPELFEVKFNKRGMLYKSVLLLEKFTFRVANYSIATNESFKKIAVERTGMPEDRIAVVRSAPPADRFTVMEGKAEYKKGKAFLVGYIGIIGEQDGLDILIRTIRILKDRKIDVHFAIIGGGTELEAIKELAKQLEIEDSVDFYGIIFDDHEINEILNSCDICVNPDVPSEYNNLITTNKVMEYMSLKKAMVQFKLKEAEYSAQKASLYANFENLEDFADKIAYLLENESIRNEMAEEGHTRFKNHLSWEIEKKKLVEFYTKILVP
ncbi:MAG: glycosyltransferase family 4 protein [Flavobacteriales bacterium]|nr:glycosyltransferase family 4 protein [Flavobacteriales bacterium]